MDGLLALQLWDLIVSVLGNISRISDRSGNLVNGENKHKSHNKIDAMKDIDSVPSNVQSACEEALLFVFEDNECRQIHPTCAHPLALDRTSNVSALAQGCLEKKTMS